MIAGHAVHAHVEGQQQLAKPLVGFRRIVLDQITRDNDAFRLPVACSVVVDNAPQRLVSVGTAQFAIGSGKQMRIREVEDPDLFAVCCVADCVNRPRP